MKMKLLVYSAKEFEIPFLNRANKNKIEISYTTNALDSVTAIQAVGYKSVAIFSGDDASSIVLEKLWDLGVRYITIRSAGYNNINLKVAKNLGFKVANAPNYSPNAIAEHAIALLLAFNRKLILANEQVHKYNFLQSNLMGFNLEGKTIGIIGTGRIGSIMVKIMAGFGCKILLNDLHPNYNLAKQYNAHYVSLEDIYSNADIISLHIPLNSENYHLIDKEALTQMKPYVIIINTSRGALVNTKTLIKVLEENKIGGYCTDVYEKEKGVFFNDNSINGIKDELLKKLLSFSNVLLTPHQAFVTNEAVQNIAEITIDNLEHWKNNSPCKNELGLEISVL